MTKQEQIEKIKRALKYCKGDNYGSFNCKECPYHTVYKCNDTLCSDTLELITEQEKEVEKITEEYKMLANQYKNLGIKYSNLSDNYRLCKDANETLKQNVVTTRKETAEDILNRINEYNLDYNWDLKVEFIKLCEDYSVEVEE